jgi:hypothetical protein
VTGHERPRNAMVIFNTQATRASITRKIGRFLTKSKPNPKDCHYLNLNSSIRMRLLKNWLIHYFKNRGRSHQYKALYKQTTVELAICLRDLNVYKFIIELPSITQNERLYFIDQHTRTRILFLQKIQELNQLADGLRLKKRGDIRYYLTKYDEHKRVFLPKPRDFSLN